jgi:hypothetical protein
MCLQLIESTIEWRTTLAAATKIHPSIRLIILLSSTGSTLTLLCSPKVLNYIRPFHSFAFHSSIQHIQNFLPHIFTKLSFLWPVLVSVFNNPISILPVQGSIALVLMDSRINWLLSFTSLSSTNSEKRIRAWASESYASQHRL